MSAVKEVVSTVTEPADLEIKKYIEGNGKYQFAVFRSDIEGMVVLGIRENTSKLKPGSIVRISKSEAPKDFEILIGLSEETYEALIVSLLVFGSDQNLLNILSRLRSYSKR